MTAQEALNEHPTAIVAHVNAAGEWHFCTPPSDFVVVETLTKGGKKEAPKVEVIETKKKK